MRITLTCGLVDDQDKALRFYAARIRKEFSTRTGRL